MTSRSSRFTLHALWETARALRRDGRSLAVFLLTYLAFLASLALFLLTSLATIPQVLITFLMPALAVALFFLLQALCLNYEETGSVSGWLRAAARAGGKLFIVSLPLFPLAWLLAGSGESLAVTIWRLLFFAFLLPLTAVHLWLATLRAGAVRAWLGLSSVLARAFAPDTLVLYTAGLIVFGLIPYLILQARLPFLAGRMQIVWFIPRVVLALALALFGWVVTVITLARKWHNKR